MIVIKPPTTLNKITSIFCAGSIENGNAENWQQVVEDKLLNKNIIIYNPRRNDWNSDWEQSMHNPEFKGQVDWELDSLEISDLILMYFDPKTTSKISLLELGLYATSKKIVVCCPEGYCCKGNVDIVCNRNNIPMFETLNEMIDYIVEKINL